MLAWLILLLIGKGRRSNPYQISFNRHYIYSVYIILICFSCFQFYLFIPYIFVDNRFTVVTHSSSLSILVPNLSIFIRKVFYKSIYIRKVFLLLEKINTGKRDLFLLKLEILSFSSWYFLMYLGSLH